MDVNSSSEKTEKTIKKRDSFKRQKLTAIVVAALFAVLAVLYFAVFRPMINARSYDQFKILDGEGMNINGCTVEKTSGSGKLSYSSDKTVVYCKGGDLTLDLDVTDARTTVGRYYMFPVMEAKDVAEIEISNEYGDFGFFLASDGNYYITDHIGTPYDQTKFTTMLAAARSPMAMKRVTESADDLSIYGLSDDKSPARVKLTDTSGNTAEFLVGDIIPTGGGYYCAVPGRRAVYILDSSTSAFVAAPESYVTPLLSLPVSDTDYFRIDPFTLKVDGEVLVSCGYMTDAERQKTASTSTYKMYVPENYVPSSDNYGNLLRKFVEFKGTETVMYGEFDKVIPESERAKYGLDKPKYEIYYKYSGVDNYVYVSEQQEDGTYYAYSLLFNLIARVDADTLDFLRWEFIDFVDRPMFQKNINDVASIRVEADGVDETFVITGSSVDDLAVTPQSRTRAFNEAELKNFRLIYRKMLGLTIEEYAPEEHTDEWLMRMTVVTDVGIEYVYDFYSYSTRRCYFMINGEGEFYCLRDRVEQIISDVSALMNGEDIDVTELG